MRRRAVLALLAALLTAAGPRPAARPAPPPREGVELAYLHDLSTPEGRLELNWVALSRDHAHGETLVMAEGFVRVFDASGMEVYRFGDDGSLGAVMRAVALDGGDFIVLSADGERRVYWRCDYRGQAIVPFTLTGLPPELAGFAPDQLVYRGGKLYLAERGTMRVVVADPGGAYVRHHDLRAAVARMVSPDEDRRPASSMDGFNVDEQGNLLFTMSTMFAAARFTPGGSLKLFGSRGSRPGTFNVVGGIDADEEGHLYVTDRLRSVVSVWDRDLQFLGEFGFRGDGPTNLIAPFEVAAGKGRVVVAQAGARGIKVFQASFTEPPPPPPPEAPDPRPPPRRRPGK